MTTNFTATGYTFTLLCLWTVIGLGWWSFAVFQRRSDGLLTRNDSIEKPGVTVFKPIPPGEGESSFQGTWQAVESFVSQLDADTELLLGVPDSQLEAWNSLLPKWEEQKPGARIRIVSRPPPDQLANPKIAWQEILATEARGEFWLWSDADVIAPAGLVDHLRSELTQDVQAVTCAYTIPSVTSARGVWDALYVNAEFLPGALLLGGRGDVDFAFGACVMFRAKVFRERTSWKDFGKWLADDFQLGQMLGKVRISPAQVQTHAHSGSWVGALRHYLRWHKTVRWCRPGGYAAMLVILPLIGWTAGVICGGGREFVAGWVFQCVAEAGLGATLLARANCALPAGGLAPLLAWPLLRAGTWIWSWLPFGVTWAGRQWTGPCATVQRSKD